ncbi:unnamed protein product [Linum trigynum]|uniref:Uncharacterized protein n=1 Tax=Linum trigynum TaxID=586398 RepID=A0AAV2CCC1_9ROSI
MEDGDKSEFAANREEDLDQNPSRRHREEYRRPRTANGGKGKRPRTTDDRTTTDKEGGGRLTKWKLLTQRLRKTKKTCLRICI